VFSLQKINLNNDFELLINVFFNKLSEVLEKSTGFSDKEENN